MTTQVYLLDYGAGNVRSLLNAVSHLGYTITPITSPEDFKKADKIIFPGVGNFGKAMASLRNLGFFEPLLDYLRSDREFLGICVGMQCLFEGSDEADDDALHRGLGLIPARVTKFDPQARSVPHMGWNRIFLHKSESSTDNKPYSLNQELHYYFVHSFRVTYQTALDDWVLGSTAYGSDQFVSAVQRGNIVGVQFHPEKSGQPGLQFLKSFLDRKPDSQLNHSLVPKIDFAQDYLTKRIVACLDVRANDQGDLVVTKGDQYDVREEGEVRNLGKPVEIAKCYYDEGADEIAFLNITSFRGCPLEDQPMLEVLRRASQNIFVPLTVGGGIRDVTQPDGTVFPAVDVAGAYFRCGADKVSIGSDAVDAAEAYEKDPVLKGTTPIETIARTYGSQAVVVSIDPRRCYVSDPNATTHHTIQTELPGPNGEKYCWFQCTSQGGRAGRDVDVIQLATACQALGAGELMVNSIDRDGTGLGYDLELLAHIRSHTTLPIVASSGAGNAIHFQEVFALQPPPEAALAAGIFHRRTLPLPNLKQELTSLGLDIRQGSH